MRESERRHGWRPQNGDQCSATRILTCRGASLVVPSPRGCRATDFDLVETGTKAVAESLTEETLIALALVISPLSNEIVAEEDARSATARPVRRGVGNA